MFIITDAFAARATTTDRHEADWPTMFILHEMFSRRCARVSKCFESLSQLKAPALQNVLQHDG